MKHAPFILHTVSCGVWAGFGIYLGAWWVPVAACLAWLVGHVWILLVLRLHTRTAAWIDRKIEGLE